MGCGFESRRARCENDPRIHLTHYVIVREDLPTGVMAAQIVHAAGESSPGDLPPNTFAVALAASDEQQLELVEHELKLRSRRPGRRQTSHREAATAQVNDTRPRSSVG